MGELRERLARQVVALLEARGWSKADLADEANVSLKHVQQVLDGRRQGTLAIWSTLFEALGYSIAIAPVAVVVKDEAPERHVHIFESLWGLRCGCGEVRVF